MSKAKAGPKVLVPLRKLIEEAIAKERPIIGIVTQRDARTEEPNSGDLYTVGCAARILKVIKLAKDNFSA
jgi:ATP-dependent Lon protease